jgi:threonine/homoserine/homoserine lactone efflux protein
VDLASLLTLVLLALFLAVQPWSVLAAILLVTARGGLKKELAFVSGWVAALAVVAVATVLLYPSVPKTSTASQAHAAVELVAGAFLAGWLLRRWRHPKDAGTDSQPSWMARLDTMPPLLAFGLGAFLPTYAVVVAAVSQLLTSGLTQASLLVAALAWVLLASAGVAAPLLVLVIDRDHAPETYHRWRAWITAHSRAVLYGVGGFVSLVLVVKGVVGLLS